ncbi:MAG: chorismate mutase [Paracoccaceae bacterium]
MKDPKDCQTMADVRAAIDELDADLVAMFARRVAYIDRAAEIKATIRMPARVTDRVEEVVANARRLAIENGLPPDMIEKLWRKMIEWSIAREESRLGKD